MLLKFAHRPDWQKSCYRFTRKIFNNRRSTSLPSYRFPQTLFLMPISEYSIETYENWSDKVVSMLSRFANVKIEQSNPKRLQVSIVTETQSADESWRQLLSELRGVASCALTDCYPEPSKLEPAIESAERPTDLRERALVP